VHGPAASASKASWLNFAPAFTLLVFLAPIAAGLIGTLLPAFGYLPALGGHEFNLDAWRTLAGQPGIEHGVTLTIASGFAATLISFLLAVLFCAFADDGRLHSRALQRMGAALAPVLATPHSALAIGFAFLMLPSGWIARVIAGLFSLWPVPPDIATVNDAWGVALVLGLVIKETPYLLLMMLAARSQVRAHEVIAIGRSLGYSAPMAWLKGVLPQIYAQVRLPVYAVLAFSLSNVDVALILGPANPPTLAVMAVRWFTDPDVTRYFPAAAAATLQLFIVVAAVALWHGGERVAAQLMHGWIGRGERGAALASLRGVAGMPVLVLLGAAALSLASMALWSIARQWRYPDVLPSQWTLDTWSRQAANLATPGWNTVLVGALATVIALVLVIACLENEQRRSLRVGSGSLWLLYMPLLLPQVAFLFGAQVLLVRTSLDGTLIAVVWAHLLFVLPYLFLSLGDPWRALDSRYARTAASLGASPARVLWRVKLPLLLAPLAIACAVAFAVSAGQYLPTLFAGNGRLATLTTEAVTLSSGADRRVIGVYAFVQSLLPLAAYLLALALPWLMHARRHRTGYTP
jgi:putative thiamine transport system permease protein